MTNIPSPFNLRLTDAHSKGTWLFRISTNPPPSVTWVTQDQFSVVINSEGRRVGDFDEQRTWNGGRGGERFSEDPTKYKDAREAATFIEGHLFPSLQWNISEGYRVAEQALPGSVSWRGLFGETRYISRSFTCAPAMTADKAWLWVRRVGTPGTLTFELCSDSAGNPSTVLKTVTKTTSDITDTLSLLQLFDWTGSESLSNNTVYHIKVYGASTDSTTSHWEVGVDTSGSSSKYSAAGSSWTTADFSMYFRMTQADLDRRWWFFYQGANFCKVSNEATAILYKWNESTDLWEAIEAATHGLGQVTGRPVEVNGFVYFPQGDSVAIRVWDGTNWDSQTIATGQGCATGLTVGYSAADNSTVIWRYNNALVSGGTTTGLKCSVSRAIAVAAYNTDLAFTNSVKIGDTSTAITGMLSVNNDLYVYKTNQVGIVQNDRYTELDYGIRDTPSSDNGIASVAWNGFVFFSWLFSTTRIYSGSVDDVGQGFKSNSFPFGREGVDSAYRRYTGKWLFVAKDAGASGTSSVMLYDGLNWHEFARAWASGRRIRDVMIQTVSGSRNRLWFDCGADSCYIELPYNKGNPLDDTGTKYMHEAIVESSLIDMGTASKLPKFIKEMTLTSKNLDGVGKIVYLDYQIDDKIGGSEWIQAGAFTNSPEDTLDINESNIRRFAYRLRIQTDDQLVPPDISGIVPNGFARSPQRKQFAIEADLKDVTINGKKQEAEQVIRWLEEAAESAYLLHMDSDFEQLNDYDILIAPPNIYPVRANPENTKITFSAMVL